VADVLDVRAIGKFFLDRAAVAEKVNAGRLKLFGRWGGSVRLTAQRSMRPGGKKGKSAEPGKPPRTHEGSLRRLVVYAFDPNTRSVVAGPMKFKRGRVPELLEYGGTAVKELVQLSGGRLVSKGNPLLKGDPGGRPVVRRPAAYKGNPYMGPAAASVNGRLAPQLKGIIG